MLKMEMNMTIITLWNKLKSISEIARIVGHDRKTVRRVIKDYKQTGTCRPNAILRPSTLDPYKEQIVEHLEKGLTAIRIHEELRAHGSPAKFRTVSHYIQKLRDKKKICVRFHSNSGEEAQIDFGYVGMLPDNDGRKRKAWIFNMRFSYSRLDYYEVVFDQKVRTFVECHINAFRYFGGVPNVVKLDNLKAAILEAYFYEPIHHVK
jgi:transposase